MGVSNPSLIIKPVYNDHNEEIGTGGGISDLVTPDTL